jgi:hypothetical protein
MFVWDLLGDWAKPLFLVSLGALIGGILILVAMLGVAWFEDRWLP